MSDTDFEKFFDAVLDALKEKRKEMQLTQEALGERMGKPQSAIARFESGGVRDPRISMIYQVCKALEINPAEAFGPAYETVRGVKPGKNIHLSQRIESILRSVGRLNETEKNHLVMALEHILKFAKRAGDPDTQSHD